MKHEEKIEKWRIYVSLSTLSSCLTFPNQWYHIWNYFQYGKSESRIFWSWSINYIKDDDQCDTVWIEYKKFDDVGSISALIIGISSLLRSRFDHVFILLGKSFAEFLLLLSAVRWNNFFFQSCKWSTNTREIFLFAFRRDHMRNICFSSWFPIQITDISFIKFDAFSRVNTS